MPYNSVADSFHTKKLSGRLSSSKVRFYTENGRFVFLNPLSGGGGLRDNVRWPSWAHWKARSGLRISVNWAFFARCYGWGATSDYRFKIGDFTATGAGWPKFQVEGVVSTNHSFCHKTIVNDLSCDIRMRAHFFHFVTNHVFDRRTDRRRDRILITRPRLHSTQRGKNHAFGRLGAASSPFAFSPWIRHCIYAHCWRR